MTRFREWLAELLLSDPAGIRVFVALCVVLILVAAVWELAT